MPVIQQYYLDAPSLGSATSVFIDSALTVCAPDGYYSDGTTVREQVGCSLLPGDACPGCDLPCNGPELIVNQATQGIFKIDSEAGAGIGAIKIWVTPQGAPVGVKAVFNSQVWNKLSSPLDGVHETIDPLGYTYIGDVAQDCGISGTTYPAVLTYKYNGTAFVVQPGVTSLTVNAGDVSLSAGAPGKCLLIIPKPTSATGTINMILASPCPTSEFKVEVDCPAPLPPFSSTSVLGSSEDACSGEMSNTYYFASLTNSASIAIYDYVFSDSNGQNPLPDGFYGISGPSGSSWIQVQNGVVIDIGTCIGCYDFYVCANLIETGSGGIKVTWLDCDSNWNTVTLPDEDDCACVQSTNAGNILVTWANAVWPPPVQGVNYSISFGGCP